MSENFQDNVKYSSGTLSVSGEAVHVGTNQAGSRSVVFANDQGSGNLVWGPSANRTISLPDNNGVVLLSSQGILSVSAGGQQATSGQVVFSNSNGMSFGMNAGTITGSYTIPSTAGLLSNINVSAGTTSNNLSAITFSNSNGLAFGLDGSTITGSYTVPTQTNQTVGLFALGNTTQSSSTTRDARSLSFNGLGNITVGYSNGSIQLSGSQSNQTANVVVPSAGTQTATSGTVVFSDSNGISFGMSGSSRITASYTVPSTAGLISAVNISGGTTSNNLTALTFSNANGVSFGLDGSTITGSVSQTNQTVGLFALGNTTQNSSTTRDARSLSFNGLGNITVGYSNGSIQLSGSQSAQTQNVVVPSAGTQTATSGTVVFSDSNGISFGMSGSSRITASYTVPSTAGLISAINVSAGTTSNNLSAITFSNSNGLTFGLNGSTLTGSYTVPTQTNQTVGLYGLGNTTQNSSTTLDARSLSFNGLGDITVGYSNGSIQISGSQTNQLATMFAVGNTTQSSSGTRNASSLDFRGAGDISVGISAGSVVVSGVQSNQVLSVFAASNTTQSSSGTINASSLIFNGAGAASVGVSNGSVIVSVPAGAGGLTNINVSAGTTSNNLSALTFADANGVSFGLNASTITGSVAAQTNQTVGLFALGNTTQNSSTTRDARSLSFNGLGIITVGYSNGSIQLSAIQTAQTQNIVVPSAGTQTATSGTVVFSDSNGISFGMSGSSRITASYTVPSTAGLISAINVSAGTTSNNLSAITFSNSNGLAFGLNGSTITGSYTVPTQTNQTVGLYALGNTTQNSSTTLDARTLSFNGLGNITVGYSNGSIQMSGSQSNQVLSMYAAGNTTQSSSGTDNASSIEFRGAGLVSVGVSNGSVVVSGTQSNQVLSVFAASNTTQSSSGTINASSLIFNGAGIASVGVSNGSVIVSVPAGGGGITNINVSAGTTSNNLSALTFSNANGVSFGLNGSTLTASVAAGGGATSAGFFATGNTTQNSTTTLALSSMLFNGLGAQTVGFSNGSVQLSVPATSSLSATGAVSISVNGNTISIGAPVDFTKSKFDPFIEGVPARGQIGQTALHIHPMPGGNNFQFDRMLLDVFVSRNSTLGSSAAFTVRYWAGLYTRNNSSLSLYASASTSTGLTVSSSTATNQSLFTGARIFPLGWTTTITNNDYWMGIISSTASANTGMMTISNYLVSGATDQFNGPLGVATNGTYQELLGFGFYSAGTTALPSSIAFSQINGTAASAQSIPFYRFLSGTA